VRTIGGGSRLGEEGYKREFHNSQGELNSVGGGERSVLFLKSWGGGYSSLAKGHGKL